MLQPKYHIDSRAKNLSYEVPTKWKNRSISGVKELFPYSKPRVLKHIDVVEIAYTLPLAYFT